VVTRPSGIAATTASTRDFSRATRDGRVVGLLGILTHDSGPPEVGEGLVDHLSLERALLALELQVRYDRRCLGTVEDRQPMADRLEPRPRAVAARVQRLRLRGIAQTVGQ